MSNEELIQLKERADLMGIEYKANIGVEALRNKINGVLASDGEPEDTTAAVPVAKSGKVEKTAAELEQAEREKQLSEQMKLVRLRITNLNPMKANSQGEIVTVANKFLGAVRKFVPFGEATDGGYHVPFIIYNELKNRKFNSVKVKKTTAANGTVVELPVGRLINEFALEILEPLSQEELQHLANQQAASAGL